MIRLPGNDITLPRSESQAHTVSRSERGEVRLLLSCNHLELSSMQCAAAWCDVNTFAWPTCWRSASVQVCQTCTMGGWLQAMRMMPPPVRDELVMAMNVDFTLIDARDEEQLSWTSHLRVR